MERKSELIDDYQRRFTYHPPKEDQIGRYEKIRQHAKSFAEIVIFTAPDSRELGEAIKHIEEAVFWANAAIARRE